MLSISYMYDLKNYQLHADLCLNTGEMSLQEHYGPLKPPKQIDLLLQNPDLDLKLKFQI